MFFLSNTNKSKGHEIVANIAYNRLSNTTQRMIQDILFPNDSFHVDDDSISPLAAVANWADKVRYTSEFAWTTPLHYVNIHDKLISGGCPSESIPDRIPSNCTFQYERDCIHDKCAVGAIVEFSHEAIGDPSQSISNWKDIPSEWNHLRGQYSRSHNQHVFTKREALMLLIHIVGDIHQPLHVSRQSDEGGNTIHVSFPQEFSEYCDERLGYMHTSWSLHSVWDVGIIEKAMKVYYNGSQKSFQDYIEANYFTNDDHHDWNSCLDGMNVDCVTKWAEESWNKVLRFAYEDENGNEIDDGSVLSDMYFESRLPVVMEQLAIGGMRLASTLERMMNPDDLSWF